MLIGTYGYYNAIGIQFHWDRNRTTLQETHREFMPMGLTMTIQASCRLDQLVIVYYRGPVLINGLGRWI